MQWSNPNQTMNKSHANALKVEASALRMPQARISLSFNLMLYWVSLKYCFSGGSWASLIFLTQLPHLYLGEEYK